MSKFVEVQSACAHCGEVNRMLSAESLNVSRSPDQRQALIDGTFQHFDCAVCGKAFVVDRPFIYTDFIRKHWIGVFPLAWEGRWAELETQALEAFHNNMRGPHSSRTAREMSNGFQIRTVFGLAALREKLVCFDAGIGDVFLEILKVLLMREIEGLRFHPQARPRLCAADAEGLDFSALRAEEGRLRWRRLKLPGQGLSEITARIADYQGLFNALSDVPYVDIGRVMLRAEAPPH